MQCWQLSVAYPKLAGEISVIMGIGQFKCLTTYETYDEDSAALGDIALDDAKKKIKDTEANKEVRYPRC